MVLGYIKYDENEIDRATEQEGGGSREMTKLTKKFIIEIQKRMNRNGTRNEKERKLRN